MPDNPVDPTLPQRAAASTGAFVLRALLGTLRLHIDDPHGFRTAPPEGPCIYAFWHNRILAITTVFRRNYPAGRKGVLVLTSASRDGMWLGEVAKRLGLGSVRGSSSRRGATAMRELIDRVEAGYDIAITPDGPRGPRYHLGPGLVYLAAKTGIPVVPMHAKFSGAWQLRTWDGFLIPKPFSRLGVSIGSPVTVPATTDEAALETERQKIESVLRAHAA